MIAFILAGDSGERFWPLSRQHTPKQFINLTGELTMLQETVAAPDLHALPAKTPA